MIDIENRDYMPSLDEMAELAGDTSFSALARTMEEEYHARVSAEFSGDKVLFGWNVRFQKAGRTLVRAYPRLGSYKLLVIVGRKEKERVEALLPSLSAQFQSIYENTVEGMGQRWLLLDVTAHGELYNDALEIIRIRRESK